MEEQSPPPPTDSQYFLKTVPISKDVPSPSAPLYLRLHGDGISSIVLTTAPPKFLRWHDEADELAYLEHQEADCGIVEAPRSQVWSRGSGT
jgi:hypothetical protein